MDNNALYRDNTVTRKKVTEYLSREEIRTLTARSDVMGAWSIASTWLLITMLFVVMAWAMQQIMVVKVPVLIIAIAMLGGASWRWRLLLMKPHTTPCLKQNGRMSR